MNTEFWKEIWRGEEARVCEQKLWTKFNFFADWDVNFSWLGPFKLFSEYVQWAPMLNNWCRTWVEILRGLRLLLQAHKLLSQTQIFWFLHTVVPNCRAGASPCSALRMESRETGWIMCLSWYTRSQDLLLPTLGLMKMPIIFWKVFNCHANRSKSYPQW